MGSKGTPATQYTQQNQQQQYTANPYTAGAGQAAIQGAEAAAGQPFQMPVAPLAPFSPFQNAAFQGTADAYGMAQPWFQMGGQYLQGSAAPITGQDVAGYYNPMAASVMAGLKDVYGQQMHDVTGRLTQAAGGVGADRIGVGQANLAKQQALATGQVMAGLYQPALQAAQQQKNMMMGAGSQLGMFGPASQAAQLQSIQAMLAAGGQQQQLAQQYLNNIYANRLAQIGYPFQTAQYLAGITGGLAPALGGTTQGQGGQLSQNYQAQAPAWQQALGIGTSLFGAAMGMPFLGAGLGTSLGTIGGTGGGLGGLYRRGGGVPRYNTGGSLKGGSTFSPFGSPTEQQPGQGALDYAKQFMPPQIGNMLDQTGQQQPPSGGGSPIGDPKAFATNLISGLPEQAQERAQNNPVISSMLAGTWQPGMHGGMQPGMRPGMPTNVNASPPDFGGFIPGNWAAPPLDRPKDPFSDFYPGAGNPGIGRQLASGGRAPQHMKGGGAPTSLPPLPKPPSPIYNPQFIGESNKMSPYGGISTQDALAEASPYFSWYGGLPYPVVNQIMRMTMPFTLSQWMPSAAGQSESMPTPSTNKDWSFSGIGRRAEGGAVDESPLGFGGNPMIPTINLPMGGGHSSLLPGQGIDMTIKPPKFDDESKDKDKQSSPGESISKFASALSSFGGEAEGGPVHPFDVGRGFQFGGGLDDFPALNRAMADVPPISEDSPFNVRSWLKQPSSKAPPDIGAEGDPMPVPPEEPKAEPIVNPPLPRVRTDRPANVESEGGDWSRSRVRDYGDYASSKYGIPSQIMRGVLNRESGFNPDIGYGTSGEWGPAQIMPKTGETLGGDRMNVAGNIDQGARYLRQMYDKFGNWSDAVAAYNAGPGAVASGRIPASTLNYRASVMGYPSEGAPDLPDTQTISARERPGPFAGGPAAGPFGGAPGMMPDSMRPYPGAREKNWGTELSRSPWMSLIKAGAAIATTPGGIGRGLAAGIKAGTEELEGQRKALVGEEAINQRAQQLYTQAQNHLRSYGKGQWSQAPGMMTADGDPIRFNKTTGEYQNAITGDPVGPSEVVRIGKSGSAKEYQFEVKRKAWLSVHPGDDAGALHFAQGLRTASDLDYQKLARQAAADEVKLNPSLDYKERFNSWYDHFKKQGPATANPQPTEPTTTASAKKVKREGTVTAGPNKGKRVVEYEDGTQEIKD